MPRVGLSLLCPLQANQLRGEQGICPLSLPLPIVEHQDTMGLGEQAPPHLHPPTGHPPHCVLLACLPCWTHLEVLAAHKTHIHVVLAQRHGAALLEIKVQVLRRRRVGELSGR